jgi:hypothetical protein
VLRNNVDLGTVKTEVKPKTITIYYILLQTTHTLELSNRLILLKPLSFKSCICSTFPSFEHNKLNQSNSFFFQENTEKKNHRIINEDQENSANNREISQEDVEEVWKYIIMI